MLGIKIKEKIDANNAIIERLMSPNVFTLNNSVSELLKENAALQDECTHSFEDGFCVYCYKEEE